MAATGRKAWSWRHALADSDLPAMTKHVLMMLSLHVNDFGEIATPTKKQLARQCSLSEKSVSTHLDLANDAGWIRVGRGGFAGKQWARENYFISMPGEFVVQGANDVPPLNAQGANDVPPLNAQGANDVPPLTRSAYIQEKTLNTHTLKTESVSFVKPETGFKEFFEAWPDEHVHKKRPEECLGIWVERRLHDERDKIVADVCEFVAKNPALKVESGRYMQQPRDYLRNAEWRYRKARKSGVVSSHPSHMAVPQQSAQRRGVPMPESLRSFLPRKPAGDN